TRPQAPGSQDTPPLPRAPSRPSCHARPQRAGDRTPPAFRRLSDTAPSGASTFMTASVSITTKYGQAYVCHPVAAPGEKSHRVIRTVESSCWMVGTAGSLHLKGMTLLPELTFLL